MTKKESIKQAYKGQAVRAEMFIPEGVNGYNPKYKSSVGYNPRLANKLLDYYGYKKELMAIGPYQMASL